MVVLLGAGWVDFGFFDCFREGLGGGFIMGLISSPQAWDVELRPSKLLVN